MSEIKVNKISPRTNCGTVTLGDSGDTFTIPAGATITNNGTAAGFGATGAASWDTTVKTGDFTAVNGVGYFVNTTSGEIDVTLPAGSPGAVVAVKDYAGTWDTNNCILISNGSEKIGGSTNNAVLSTEGLAVTLVYIDSTQGWLVTDDGLQSQAETNPYMVATGGTITEDGNCKVHTFTGPGTFTVCKTATSAADNVVSYVVVAGGGSGGGGSPNSNNTAGGGGAGGFREVVSPSSPYTGSPLNGYPTPGNRITVTATAFPITVGAGAAINPGGNTLGNNGSNSVFSTITSAGGGGGGGANPSPSRAGSAGGSGGGGAGGTGPSASGGTGNTPSTTPAQGNDGGDYSSTSPDHASSGGGGATATGFDKPGGICGLAGGPGGSGATTSIPGTATGFAGGGGGGAGACGCASNNTQFPNGRSPSPGIGQADTLGFGGASGGRSGGFGGAAGTANKGGGGGGGAGSNPPAPNPAYFVGGAGGSGIVIIRYKFQ